MRVVLIGPVAARAALRARLPAGLQVVGEAASFAAARGAGYSADAWMTTAGLSDGASGLRDGTPGLRDPAYGGDDGPVVEAHTPRELEVLELRADGLPDERIAAALGLSPDGPEFHGPLTSGRL